MRLFLFAFAGGVGGFSHFFLGAGFAIQVVEGRIKRARRETELQKMVKQKENRKAAPT